ncbi:MAG: hypothetical protein BWK80_20760 [Desulfobacteraceae bacterium IS3]|nr:MAG: hypothetical protein BWK80_20760 [Desulfobacteraceae bacterium IS3]
MSNLVTDESWVWAVIQNPEGEARLVGQHDKENDITFVPIFLEKEEALKCYNLLSLAKGPKYEVQALLYEELVRDAFQNRLIIFIMNGSGEILDKVYPQ